MLILTKRSESANPTPVGLVRGRSLQHSSQETDIGVLTDSLYRQNAELAVKNKTLSLLGRLYEISIQILGSKELSVRIAAAVQETLNLEFVTIYRLDPDTDTLTVLGCAESAKVQSAEGKSAFKLCSVDFASVSKHPFFSEMLRTHTMRSTESPSDLWNSSIPEAALQSLYHEAHIKGILCYPLVIGTSVSGLLVVGLNRVYKALSEHERSAIGSTINVIAVALDKAKLYEKLTLTNQMLESANTRLKELDQLKSEFVSLATHQIRGPLTAIKGYASMIREGDYGAVPDSLKSIIDTIFDSSDALSVVVQDFLDISRIEQGKMKYDFSEFDFSKLVADVAQELRPNVEHKKLTLDLDVEPNIKVYGDIGKLRQVIENLIDNSLKYTPKGSIHLAAKRSGAGMVRMTIKDTGVGIKPEVLPKLFQKFSRAEDASKANLLGTGLGLYVARQLIEAQKGRVWAESEGEGKGSTFSVELPLKM